MFQKFRILKKFFRIQIFPLPWGLYRNRKKAVGVFIKVDLQTQRSYYILAIDDKGQHRSNQMRTYTVKLTMASWLP